MDQRIVYISRLMRCKELHAACQKFREQEETRRKSGVTGIEGGSTDVKYRRDTHPGLSVACR